MECTITGLPRASLVVRSAGKALRSARSRRCLWPPRGHQDSRIGVGRLPQTPSEGRRNPSGCHPSAGSLSDECPGRRPDGPLACSYRLARCQGSSNTGITGQSYFLWAIHRANTRWSLLLAATRKGAGWSCDRQWHQRAQGSDPWLRQYSDPDAVEAAGEVVASTTHRRDADRLCADGGSPAGCSFSARARA